MFPIGVLEDKAVIVYIFSIRSFTYKVLKRSNGISSLTINSALPRILGAAGLALIGLAVGGRKEVLGLEFDRGMLKVFYQVIVKYYKY